MAFSMTKSEREAYLAGVHVGILSVSEESKGPFAVPVWYAYEPGGEVRVVTVSTTKKAKLIERAGRFSLLAQTEAPPYKYASVEGPVVAMEPADLERDLRPLCHRYLGKEQGDGYFEMLASMQGERVLIRMRPERWLTADYSKASG